MAMHSMKMNSFGAAAAVVLVLYAPAIAATWFRKHTFDPDLIFWMGMTVLLLSGFEFSARRK